MYWHCGIAHQYASCDADTPDEYLFKVPAAAAPLPSQLPADDLGKVTEDGPSIWTFAVPERASDEVPIS